MIGLCFAKKRVGFLPDPADRFDAHLLVHVLDNPIRHLLGYIVTRSIPLDVLPGDLPVRAFREPWVLLGFGSHTFLQNGSRDAVSRFLVHFVSAPTTPVSTLAPIATVPSVTPALIAVLMVLCAEGYLIGCLRYCGIRILMGCCRCRRFWVGIFANGFYSIKYFIDIMATPLITGNQQAQAYLAEQYRRQHAWNIAEFRERMTKREAKAAAWAQMRAEMDRQRAIEEYRRRVANRIIQ